MLNTKIINSFKSLNVFSSRNDYLSNAKKYLGVRLSSLVITSEELRKRVKGYGEIGAINKFSDKASVLFNNHIGVISPVNKLKLVEEVDPEEYIFFRCRAIDAGGFEKSGNKTDLHGYNDNGDYFSVEELLKETTIENEQVVPAFATFVGKQFFTNHKNDDVSLAKGIIVNAFYDLEDHTVYCDIMVDKLANPELSRAIEQGYITDVSMGCAVEWSECSVCSNKAHNLNEYCEHIKNSKGRKFANKDVYEINHNLKFIEISAVTEGAFKNCMISDILSQDDLVQALDEMKDASQNIMLKSSHSKFNECLQSISSIVNNAKNKLGELSNDNSQLVAQASGAELTKLYNALDSIREVMLTMVKIENVIDYEYVTDLSKVLESLQKVIYDLASIGFGDEEELPEIGTGPKGAGGEEGGGEKNIEPSAPSENAVVDFPSRGESIPRPEQKEELPIAAKKDIRNKLLSMGEKINNYIDDCKNIMKLSKENSSKDTFDVEKSYIYDAKDDDETYLKVKLSDFRMDYIPKQEVVKSYHKNRMVQEKAIKYFSPVIAELIRINPETTLENMIKLWKNLNDRGNAMTQKNISKISATDKVLQRQLEEDNKGNSKHVRDDYDADLSILQGQLDSITTTPETGSSEYLLEGNVQKGRTSTERINPDHKVDRGIGEAQLKDRRVANDTGEFTYGTGEDQLESRSREFTTGRTGTDIDVPITESQMETVEMGNRRLNFAIMSITEEQMASQREDDSLAGTSGQTKWSKKVGDNIITALTNSIIEDKLTPDQIVEACSSLCNEDNDILTSSIDPSELNTTSDEDIVNKIAARIAKVNRNEGLYSTVEKDNIQWRKILSNALSAFVENQTSLKKVLAKKSNEYIDSLKNVIAGQKKITSVSEVAKKNFSNVLNGYLDNEGIKTNFILSASLDFVRRGKVLTASDGNAYLTCAAQAVSEILSEDYGVDIPASEILIEDIKNTDEDIVSGIAVISEKYSDLISESKKPTKDLAEDWEDEDEGEEGEEEVTKALKEVDLMKKAFKKISQQVGNPPSGWVGQGQEQQGAAPEAPPAGDAGLGTMSTPEGTDEDFGALDTGEEDMGDGDQEVGEPKLPGTRCPSCGEIHNIEQVDDEFECGKCGTRFSVSINVEVLEGPALNLRDEQGNEDVEPEGDEEMQDEQNEITTPTNAQVPAAPVGGGGMGAPQAKHTSRMHKISGIPTVVKYTAEPEVLVCFSTIPMAASNIKAVAGQPIAPGHRCPSCGSCETYCEDSKFQCCACGTAGKFKITQNSKDGSFADITLAYLSNGAKRPLTKADSVRLSLNDRIANAKKVVNIRTAESNLNKTIDESLQDLVRELNEDGYSIKDAKVLQKIVTRSMVAEQLQKEEDLNDEENEMPDRNLINDEDENLLDDALELEDDVEQDVEDIETDIEDVDEEYVTLDSEMEDDLNEGLEDIDTDGGITIDINGPDESVTIEIGPDGEISVNQEEEEIEVDVDGEDFDLEDDVEVDVEDGEEYPDFIGEEEVSDDFEEEIEEDEGSETTEDEIDDAQESIEDAEEDLDEAEEEVEEAEEYEEEEDAEEAEDEDEDEYADAEESEIETLSKAMLMNHKSINKVSDGFANTLNFNKLVQTLGLKDADIKRDATAVKKAKNITKTSKVNVADANDMKKLLVQALNYNEQTQPLDVEGDVDAGVPRDKSVGFNKVPYEPVRSPANSAGGGVATVKTDKYVKGKGANVNGETSVVPRSPSDSGMSGQGALDFAEEKANAATSGNPDTYVQKYRKPIAPTSKGSEGNRVRASSNKKVKTAGLNKEAYYMNKDWYKKEVKQQLNDIDVNKYIDFINQCFDKKMTVEECVNSLKRKTKTAGLNKEALTFFCNVVEAEAIKRGYKVSCNRERFSKICGHFDKDGKGNIDECLKYLIDKGCVVKDDSKTAQKKTELINKIHTIAEKEGINPKEIQVKKVGDLYIAAHKNKVWNWGNKNSVTKDITIDFSGTTVHAKKGGVLKAVAKQNDLMVMQKTASSESQAAKIVSMAQNVPEQFLETADFQSEYVIVDTRNDKKFVIRKAKKRS